MTSDTNTVPESLPTDCPQCGKTLETRKDVMVEMFAHAGGEADE